MIYITGDTHREQDIAKINPDDKFPIGKTMTDKDYLIIAGDFGCIWDGADGDTFWLNWLESLPWTTCFIDGNHENFELLKDFPTEVWKGGRIHRIRSNVVHLMRGEIFDIDGTRFFTFGGGYSHDVQYRVEKVNWWKDEIPTWQEVQNAYNNLDDIGWKVDCVISHDIYSQHPFAKKFNTSLAPYGQGYAELNSFLNDVEAKLDYQYWFHGHYHTDQLFYSKKQKPCITLFDDVIRLDQVDTWIEEHK